MTNNLKKFNIKKSIAHVILISCPLIILAGYCVYLVRDWLFESKGITVPDPIYWIIVFFAMWAAMWLTSYKILRDIFYQGKPDETNST